MSEICAAAVCLQREYACSGSVEQSAGTDKQAATAWRISPWWSFPCSSCLALGVVLFCWTVICVSCAMHVMEASCFCVLGDLVTW